MKNNIRRFQCLRYLDSLLFFTIQCKLKICISILIFTYFHIDASFGSSLYNMIDSADILHFFDTEVNR